MKLIPQDSREQIGSTALIQYVQSRCICHNIIVSSSRELELGRAWVRWLSRLGPGQTCSSQQVQLGRKARHLQSTTLLSFIVCDLRYIDHRRWLKWLMSTTTLELLEMPRAPRWTCPQRPRARLGPGGRGPGCCWRGWARPWRASAGRCRWSCTRPRRGRPGATPTGCR